MKKSDLEVLSLSLLAAACGQVPEDKDSRTSTAPQATTPASSSEPTKASSKTTAPMLGSAPAQSERSRTGRTGGVVDGEPQQAPNRTGRGGGRTER
jgi:hypothetical protein